LLQEKLLDCLILHIHWVPLYPQLSWGIVVLLPRGYLSGRGVRVDDRVRLAGAPCRYGGGVTCDSQSIRARCHVNAVGGVEAPWGDYGMPVPGPLPIGKRIAGEVCCFPNSMLLKTKDIDLRCEFACDRDIFAFVARGCPVATLSINSLLIDKRSETR
jgi:hypothetical protein